MKNFVPQSFKPIFKIELEGFILRKLTAKDVKLDYEAVMSSIETIKKIRGGSWPSYSLTFEDNLIDLSWHQREFEFKTSFAYTVLNLIENKCLGCVYIYPPDKPWIKSPAVTDAVVNMWVTTDTYKDGLYPKLFKAVQKWITTEWPFKKVFYSNKEIPLESL